MPQTPYQELKGGYVKGGGFAVPNAVPLGSGVERLDAPTVCEYLRQRACLLVDVRDADRGVGCIEGALHVPAVDPAMPFYARVPELVRQWAGQPLVVFMCQYSAHRAPQCATWYRQQNNPRQRVAILVDGFRGWESFGLPVTRGEDPAHGADEDFSVFRLAMEFTRANLWGAR